MTPTVESDLPAPCLLAESVPSMLMSELDLHFPPALRAVAPLPAPDTVSINNEQRSTDASQTADTNMACEKTKQNGRINCNRKTKQYRRTIFLS